MLYLWLRVLDCKVLRESLLHGTLGTSVLVVFGVGLAADWDRDELATNEITL